MTCTLEKKPSVIWDVCPEIEAAQDVIAKAYLEAKAKAVVTSARDSKHSAHTAHTDGRAIDLRITNLFIGVSIYAGKEWWEKVLAFAHDLAIALEQVQVPGRFDLVLEKDHIHLEYSSTATPNIKGWDPGKFVYQTSEVKGYMA